MLITPVNPTDGKVGVAKDDPIIFDATDESDAVDLGTLDVSINGVLIVSNGDVVSDGWGLVAESLPDGYRIHLIHTDRKSYFEDNSPVQVRAYIEDVLSDPATEVWSFNVTRLGLRVYPLIFEGVRKADETGGQ